jgi:hypothetical protein
VKAEVVLPDRKYAKLWSGMRHEEYADEAPLLKVRNVKSPVFVQSRTLHVLTYVFAKDQNHVKTSIHILLQKTFNV